MATHSSAASSSGEDDGQPGQNQAATSLTAATTIATTIQPGFANPWGVPAEVVSLETTYPGDSNPKTSTHTGVLPVAGQGTFSPYPASKGSPGQTAGRSNVQDPGSSITTNSAGQSTPLEGSLSRLSPSSTRSPQVDTQGSPGVTSGAVVGIAIGCAALGILIGAVVACVLFRRKRDRKPQAEYTGPVQYLPEDKFASGDKGLAKIPANYDLQLDQFILDSRPDTELASELRALGQLVQQHVENHYHLQPVQGSPNALASMLVNLGLNDQPPFTITDLASLALDHRTRWIALQYIICRVAFESTVLGSSAPISLLPPFSKDFIDSLLPVESHRGSVEGKPELPSRPPDHLLTLRIAVQVALTRWRQLSVFLVHPNRSERTPLAPSEDVSTHQAQRLAVSLGRFLQTFVPAARENRYEQENHLREAIVECATFGYVLFSQPSEYQFQWDAQSKHSAIVTCPGLAKISDEKGRRYSSPQIVVSPVVEVI